VRRAMKRVALHLTEATEIVIHVGHGAATMTQREEDTPLPGRPLEIPAKPPKITACMKAVLLTVSRADGRMTQPKIAKAMRDAGMHVYSDRWIADACQRLVELGLLKHHPDGYEPVLDDDGEAGPPNSP
jgi:hypothetical protein